MPDNDDYMIAKATDDEITENMWDRLQEGINANRRFRLKGIVGGDNMRYSSTKIVWDSDIYIYFTRESDGAWVYNKINANPTTGITCGDNDLLYVTLNDTTATVLTVTAADYTAMPTDDTGRILILGAVIGSRWYGLSSTDLDHTKLLNVGTNTHSQIDTHLGSTSNPHGVVWSDVSSGHDGAAHSAISVTDLSDVTGAGSGVIISTTERNGLHAQLHAASHSDGQSDVVNHNNLTNGAGNQHIDWTSASSAFATTGLVSAKQGDTVYGLSTQISLEVGVDGSKPGAIRIRGGTAASGGLIQATTNNLHIDALGGNIYIGSYDNSVVYFNGSSYYIGTGGNARFNIGADDVTYTGLVTSDNGLLKYRTKAEVLSDIAASPLAGSSSIVTVGTLSAGDVRARDSVGLISSKVSGDIFYWTSALQRLQKGTDGEVLKLVSGLPSWGAAGGYTEERESLPLYPNSRFGVGSWTWVSTDEYVQETGKGGTTYTATCYFYPTVTERLVTLEVRVYGNYDGVAGGADSDMECTVYLEYIDDGGTWTTLQSGVYTWEDGTSGTQTITLSSLTPATAVGRHYRIRIVKTANDGASMNTADMRIYAINLTQ